MSGLARLLEELIRTQGPQGQDKKERNVKLKDVILANGFFYMGKFNSLVCNTAGAISTVY